jgi:membrane protein DedA with SNARE-associated domain
MSGIPRLIEHFPYMGIFVLLVLGGIGFPSPEGVILILCGFLISTEVIKPIPALFIAYSGVLIGDFLAYYLGRKYGRMIVTHKKFHKIILPERLLSLED